MNVFLAFCLKRYSEWRQLWERTTIWHQTSKRLRCVARVYRRSIHKCECHNIRIYCSYNHSFIQQIHLSDVHVDYIFFNLLRTVDSLCCVKATRISRTNGRNKNNVKQIIETHQSRYIRDFPFICLYLKAKRDHFDSFSFLDKYGRRIQSYSTWQS